MYAFSDIVSDFLATESSTLLHACFPAMSMALMTFFGHYLILEHYSNPSDHRDGNPTSKIQLWSDTKGKVPVLALASNSIYSIEHFD